MTERARIGIVVLAGLVIGALAAVMTASEGSRSGSEMNLIAHSAEAAGAAGSARADYRMSMSMGSVPSIGFTGEAAFDFAAEALSMTMDLDVPGAAGFGTEMRLVDGVMYMRMPPELGAPTPWASFDIAGVVETDALAGLGTGADIRQTLDYLRGAGDVTEIGREEINGVTTTHYRAEIDLRKAADQVPPGQQDEFEAAIEQFELMAGTISIPADVWIDDAGLPRRMSYRITVDNSPLGDRLPGDGSLTMSLSMDLYDYGEPVSVSAPPASQVTDMTADLDRLSGLSTF